MRFKEKVCLVTGAGSGIGRATAQRFAAEGGKVVIIDKEEENGKETVDMITQNNGQAVFSMADVGNEEHIKSTVNLAIDKWQKIDVLVNCAGMMTFKKIVDLSADEWDKLMAVNLRSMFLFCKYSIPYISGGSIVNISSVHAHQSSANVIPYASSKGAIEAFTRGISLEYPSTHLRCNCVAPGAVDTPMLWNNPNVKKGIEKIEGAVGKPEDLAAAICFLASDEAAFINGTTVMADGGRTDIL
jgi:glucose 1-dehydrogenase